MRNTRLVLDQRIESMRAMNQFLVRLEHNEMALSEETIRIVLGELLTDPHQIPPPP